MGIFQSFAGTVRVELTSADLAGALTAINSVGIILFSTVQTGDLTMEMTLYRRDYADLVKLIRRRGEKLRLVNRLGLYWTGKRLLKRPILLIGVAFLLWLVLFLPTRVLFIRVEGNVTIPTRLILEQAAQCGIDFGAARREVRSEQMKNALLGAIPELQWAGINTTGCVATISVRERAEVEEVDQGTGVSSIVAIRDGVVQEMTVLRGSPTCQVGQAVQAGEVLISGYTDCGISIQATRAQGEVFAQTKRCLVLVSPGEYIEKGEVQRIEKKYSLLIGKKRINFYKDSGILDTSCDKMYFEYVLTLPGGFALPIALAVEQSTYYTSHTVSTDEERLQETLSRFAEQYLLSQMVAGQILERQEVVDQGCLYGEYACQEMIGREQSEEIIQSNGESN